MHNITPIEKIIEDAANGKMFILVDDENRENEGDFVIPAQFIDAEKINFMAKHGRGLICLTLTKERINQLGLPLMAQSNGSRHQTAFTVSIEAREGVSTGISAHDRAHTVQTAINCKSSTDIVSPGHIFPLAAREGGVLVRAGHTEAAVDIARLAGLNPSGVICEIMNEDGTMARLPDLIKIAQNLGLNIGTIADLIAYRRKNEKLIRKIAESDFASSYGTFKLMVYQNTLEYAEHLVLVKGDIAKQPALVRMHQHNILNDSLGGSATLQKSMQAIEANGSGVIVIIRTPDKAAISRQLTENTPNTLREYGIGAQILLDLGLKQIELLTNSKKSVVGLEGYGIEIVGYRPII
jgi:3,4-dihydroxy 2-butanone 4-phosphate synthase/GTP cyclohydrolase II